MLRGSPECKNLVFPGTEKLLLVEVETCAAEADIQHSGEQRHCNGEKRVLGFMFRCGAVGQLTQLGVHVLAQ